MVCRCLENMKHEARGKGPSNSMDRKSKSGQYDGTAPRSCNVQGGRICAVPAVKQAHTLVVTFQLPSLLSRYLAKADEYLSCLVGHEGRGSLLSLLKARGWATALSAGVPEGGYERNTALYLFDVTVTLTEAGLRAEPGGLASPPCSLEYSRQVTAKCGRQGHARLYALYNQDSKAQEW